MNSKANGNLMTLTRSPWTSLAGDKPRTVALPNGKVGDSRLRRQGLLIVGGGPAGLAPLFAAASVGRLAELLDKGVTIVERSGQLGAGALSTYGIQSDSTAAAFLDIVKGSRQPELRALENHPAAIALQRLGAGEAPLPLVGELLQAAGHVISELVAGSRHGRVLTGTHATNVRQASGGGWVTHVQHPATGPSEGLGAERVLLTTGAHQPVERLLREPVAGAPLLPRFGHKVVQSGVVLAGGGLDLVASRLRGISHPRVAIVGGSTSAAATAVLLLQRLPEQTFAASGLSLLHRAPIRICYSSVEEANAAGDTSFTMDDVCPLTRRVNRFSGLRLSSRELLMRAQGLGTEAAEPRLRLLRLGQNEDEAQRVLEGADLIIPALGYRPLLLPVLDGQGSPVPLHNPSTADWSMIDSRFRVRRWDGVPLEGLHASGLATGPVPDRSLGGELGFRGQVNSLWMWQHNLGMRLLEEVLSRTPRLRPYSLAKAVCLPSAEPIGRMAAASAGGAR